LADGSHHQVRQRQIHTSLLTRLRISTPCQHHPRTPDPYLSLLQTQLHPECTHSPM
jgi:hypothetical protein